MTELQEGSALRRQIHIYGIEGPVQMEMTTEGISLWIKGSKKRVSITWPKIVESSETSSNVPSFLMGRPLDFLKHQVIKKQDRANKK